MLVGRSGEPGPLRARRRGHLRRRLGPAAGILPVGSRWSLGGRTSPRSCSRRAARPGSTAMPMLPGPVGADRPRGGIRTAVGTPIIVEGRLWGVMIVGSQPGSSPCRRTPRHGWPRSPSWWRRRSRTPRAAPLWPGWLRSRRRCGGWRRWWRAGCAGGGVRGGHQGGRAAASGRFGGAWTAMSRTARSPSSQAGAASRRTLPVGSRWNLGGTNLATLVSETGRPARIDSYRRRSGPLGAAVREAGVRSAVGTPIIVEGRLWGMMRAGSTWSSRCRRTPRRVWPRSPSWWRRRWRTPKPRRAGRLTRADRRRCR